MKKIECEIQGISAMLQHRFNDGEHGQNASKSKKKVYVPEEEAEKAVYRNEAGEIYQPSEHILGALIKSSTSFKYEGKKTFKDIIKGSVIVEPEAIPLMKKENGEIYKQWDEIDARNVVIQRARVIRWRPKFNEWKLRFILTILDDDFLSLETLKEILEYSGRYGIGDYRPRFGRFMVTEFKETK